MYHYLIKSNNILYISNKVVSRLPIYSKVEGIEKNYIKLNCSFESSIDITKKELYSISQGKQPLFPICEDLRLPYNNQIISLTKYPSYHQSKQYTDHINFQLWKILTYVSISRQSVYALLMNATKSNYVIGVSGYTLSILNNNRISYEHLQFSSTKR